jgi:hypothetical protein
MPIPKEIIDKNFEVMTEIDSQIDKSRIHSFIYGNWETIINDKI